MRITVQSAKDEGGRIMAAYLRMLLQEHGIPVEDVVDGTVSGHSITLKRKALEIGSRLEEPIVITHEDGKPHINLPEHLMFDPEISETSPIIKGTWITVSQIISMIIDGYTWTDILRTHPELCEDDIRACLNFHLSEEGPL